MKLFLSTPGERIQVWEYQRIKQDIYHQFSGILGAPQSTCWYLLFKVLRELLRARGPGILAAFTGQQCGGRSSPLAQIGAGSLHYFLLSRAGIYVASFPCVPSVRFSNASPSPALLCRISSQRAPFGLGQGLLCFVNSEVGSLGYQIRVFLVWSRGQIALHLPTPVFLRGSNTFKDEKRKSLSYTCTSEICNYVPKQLSVAVIMANL